MKMEIMSISTKINLSLLMIMILLIIIESLSLSLALSPSSSSLSSSETKSSYRLSLPQKSSTTTIAKLFNHNNNDNYNDYDKHQQKRSLNDEFFNQIKDRFYFLRPIMLLRNGNSNNNNNNDNNNNDNSQELIDFLSNYNNDNKLINGRNNYSSRKRSCLINAGLSNNCDFRDYISASNARRIWESQASPGKRSSLQSQDYSMNLMPPNRLSYELADSPPQQPQQYPSAMSGEDIKNNDQRSKRMNCISGLPGGDCENSFLGGESLGQDFLRPGGRNPGRR